MTKLVFRLTIQELIKNRRAMLAVLAILLIGFLGPLFATSLRTSAGEFLKQKSREILSADLVLSALRPFEDAERKALEGEFKPKVVSYEIDMVTMASSAADASTSILSEVRGIDEFYPVHGQFRIAATAGLEAADAKTAAVSVSAKDLMQTTTEARAWAFRDVFVQLGLKVGDKIRLGRSEFVLAGEVVDGPGVLRSGFGLAPRIYIDRRAIESTGLLGFGSQVTHRIYFGLGDHVDLDKVSARAKELVPSPDVFLRTPEDSIQGIERFLGFFSRYLGVITLVIFSLSWVSAYYILEIFLSQRLRDATVLITLGAKRRFVFFAQALQVFFVSFSALVIGTGVVAACLKIAMRVFASRFPEGLQLSIHIQDLLQMVLIAALSALVFTLPFVLQLLRIEPKVLLNENVMGAEKATPEAGWRRVIIYAPLIILFWGLAVWLMDSWRYGSGLLGGILAALIIGWLLARGLFRLAYLLLRGRPSLWRLAITNLARSRFGTSLCFLVLCLVAVVLNLVPHLLDSTINEIKPTSGRDRPALFLFNIPEAAVEDLKSFTSERGGELRYLSPMVLARLEKVNGARPENEFFQRFPVRLSYREGLIPSEKIIDGEDFSGNFDPNLAKLPKISMEVRFAERNGFKIGDQLEFEIQGVPVAGEVVNLRRVRWTDFHPNFFMEFQGGVLEDAPKTFISNLNLQEGIDKAKFQFDLIRKFPDLSIVDIGRTIDRILDLTAAMLGPIQAIAWVSVAMSLLILLAVVWHNLQLRVPEFDMLKVLGADGQRIQSLITREYVLIGILASVVGAGFAALIAVVVSEQIFDITPQLNMPIIGLSIGWLVFASWILAWLAGRLVLTRAGLRRSGRP